jgi:anti-sigma regulatory factor (Ser/Thr protein kinase)
MATVTAPGTQAMPPVADQLGPALARWPLRAALELGALPTAPGCARAWTRQIAWEWRLPRLADSAELVVSELVTNAVQASRAMRQAAVRIWLVSDGVQVVVFVWDASPQRPARADLVRTPRAGAACCWSRPSASAGGTSLATAGQGRVGCADRNGRCRD